MTWCIFLVILIQCSVSGYTPALGSSSSSDREALIQQYFNQGYTYSEICGFLLFCHGIVLSVSHLKRILKRLRLQRKKCDESPLEDIIDVVLREIECSGRCVGYKTLWKRLQKTYKLKVKRQTVLAILRILDPIGIQTRRQRRFIRRDYVVPGPNFVWHVDGYDKLKPFGFAIHGAIDGYSRRVMWLEVASSNNNPKITAYYYLNCVKQLQKVPRLMRGDKGTENTLTSDLQNYFRYYDNDTFAGLNSYLAGKSTSNQRIECWWSQMRRLGADWWISHFKDLRDQGFILDTDPLLMNCLRYCYGLVLQCELQTIMEEWNQHRIRRQKKMELAAGKPDVLYFLPELTNSCDYGKQVDVEDVNVCLTEYCEEPQLYNPLFENVIQLLKPGTMQPTSVTEAKELYLELLTLLHDMHYV